MILSSVPSYDTMYFEIPSNTYNSNVTSYAVLDSNPSEQINFRSREFSASSTPLKQVTTDGINIKEIQMQFKICCNTASEHLLINKYFQSVSNQSFILYNTLSGETNKDIVINGWNITMKNSLYGDITVNAELVH